MPIPETQAYFNISIDSQTLDHFPLSSIPIHQWSQMIVTKLMLLTNTFIQSLNKILLHCIIMRVCPALVIASAALIRISIEDVFNALINLEPNKAPGLDNIGPSILKNNASVLATSLQYLFSLSLSRGIILNEW